MPSDSTELSAMFDQILTILESIKSSMNNSHNKETAFSDKWKEIKELTEKAKDALKK